MGIFGKWGTGKTSTINMAMDEIYTYYSNEQNKPLILNSLFLYYVIMQAQPKGGIYDITL